MSLDIPAARKTPAEIRPLRLRRIAPEAAAAGRALAKAGPLQLAVGGATATLQLANRQLGEEHAGPWLAFTAGGAPAWAALTWPVAAEAAGQALDGADPGDAALVLEASLAPWLDRAEAALGLALGCTAVGRDSGPPRPDDPALLRRTLIAAGRDAAGTPINLRVALVLSPAAALSLSAALPLAAAASPPLALRAAVERDLVTLTVAELAALGPGDAILAGQEAGMRLVLEGRLCAPLRRGPGGLHLAGALQATAEPQHRSGGDAMPDPHDRPAPPEAAPALDAATLDEVEVRVSFRAGEVLMDLARLRALAPGAVVELPEPADTTVQIVVNGRIVGTGELIDLAGRRAIEIRTIFDRT